MSVRKRNKIIIAVLAILIIGGLACFISYQIINKKVKISIDLNNLTYVFNGEKKKNLKEYSIDKYDDFVKDYKSGKLPDVYITEFLFDGVSMYKSYDLDDFIENGNDVDVENFKIKTLNINCSHDIELTGELKGMIAVNSNKLIHDVTLSLNSVNIDTESKKVPAIYIYNKDTTYSKHKVTISTLSGTTNTIEGGKLKKVSLIGSDELSNYSDKYNGDAKENYNKYSKYYGIYSKSDIDNVLFAKVEADSDDLKDGAPVYFYKASGVISSDIDIYFDGKGKLNVISKSKEGIESKGNITMSGKTGDYNINAMDDCINTTTKSNKNDKDDKSRNSIVIDVASLTAIVNSDASEGDAIDSNGTLTINGGRVIAIAKSGSDAGLDSESGTYINGGVVIATGDMFDNISSDSKQRFIGLSFGEKISKDDLILMSDSSNNVIFVYKTDREYSNLVYSSELIEDESYYMYKNGKIVGTDDNGFYSNATAYDRGTMLGYASKGVLVMGNNRGTLPMENPQDKKDGNDTPHERLDDMRTDEVKIEEPTNKEFVVNGISNLFSGIGVLVQKSS